MHRGFTLLGLVSTLAFSEPAVAGLFSSAPEGKLGTVQRADLVQQVTVAGTVIPNRRTMFTAPYNAYVKILHVAIGSTVKAGAPVVTLVQSLRGEEDSHPLRAPFTGLVTQVLKTEGEFVESAKDSNGIVRVDDLSRLFILSDVPEGDIEKLKLGQETNVQIAGLPGKTYHGVVREIFLSAREKKEWNRAGDRVEFPIRIEIVDKDAEIHAGMSGIVDIITAKREKVLTLRHEFLRKSKGGGYYVTTAEGTTREVKVGLQNEESFEISSGLAENDRVKMVDFIALAREGEREIAGKK